MKTLRRLFNNDGGAYFCILEKLFCHKVRHSDTTVRGCISGKETCVHTDAVVESKEVWHRCANKHFVWPWFMNARVGILIENLTSNTMFNDAI